MTTTFEFTVAYPIHPILEYFLDGFRPYGSNRSFNLVAMLSKFFFKQIEEEDLDNIWFQQDGATCHTANATLNGIFFISHYFGIGSDSFYFLRLKFSLFDIKILKKKARQTFRPHMGALFSAINSKINSKNFCKT